jgi:hypothetical protein
LKIVARAAKNFTGPTEWRIGNRKIVELLHGSVLSAVRFTVSLPRGRVPDQIVRKPCPQHWADIADITLKKVSGTLKAAQKHGESEPPESSRQFF